MYRTATALVACVPLLGTAAVPIAQRGPALEAGLFLYAMPGLPDPNFEKTVVLLIEHGPRGSMGLVVNRPTDRRLAELEDVQEGTMGLDVPVFRGGPVQPEVLLALVRSSHPGLHGRTVVPDVRITPDLDDVRAALAERDGRLGARVFSGYAGWDKGQLAAEVRLGSWVLDRADAATVFSPEPSRLWEKVHEILTRVQVRSMPPPSIDSESARRSSH